MPPFFFFFSCKIPPSLLSNSDNVQMQKHRHLLRFKAPVSVLWNSNCCTQWWILMWPDHIYLSGIQKDLTASLILSDTEETLKRSGLSAALVRECDRCLQRDMFFLLMPSRSSGWQRYCNWFIFSFWVPVSISVWAAGAQQTHVITFTEK